VQDARRMFDETGCAGVMVGRGAIRNPWLPLQISQFLRGLEPTAPSRTQRHQMLHHYFEQILNVYPKRTGRVGRMKMVIRFTAESLADGARLKAMALPMKTRGDVLNAVDRFFMEPTTASCEAP